jgi:hypothetical protein
MVPGRTIERVLSTHFQVFNLFGDTFDLVLTEINNPRCRASLNYGLLQTDQEPPNSRI